MVQFDILQIVPLMKNILKKSPKIFDTYSTQSDFEFIQYVPSP